MSRSQIALTNYIPFQISSVNTSPSLWFHIKNVNTHRSFPHVGIAIGRLSIICGSPIRTCLTRVTEHLACRIVEMESSTSGSCQLSISQPFTFACQVVWSHIQSPVTQFSTDLCVFYYSKPSSAQLSMQEPSGAKKKPPQSAQEGT